MSLTLSLSLSFSSSLSSVFTRTFCDADKALLSCPAGMRVVFHNTLFYGQMNTSESCPVTASGSCSSGLKYGVMNEYCWGVNKCDIPKISATEFKLRQCKDTSNYLTIHHSCQRGKCSSSTATASLLPFFFLSSGLLFKRQMCSCSFFYVPSRSVDTHTKVLTKKNDDNDQAPR